IGTVTFSYTVQDNLGAVSNIATVTVSVNAANTPPHAANDLAVTLSGTPAIINVIANDTDANGFINPTSVQVITAPANGTAIANSNGTVTYTPTAGFSGTNTFSYVVADNLGALSNVATVQVTVNSAAILPVASADTATTTGGLAVSIPVLSNDTAAAINPASVLVVTPPANGTVVANADGTVTYTPNPGYVSTAGPPAVPDTFTYTFKDTQGTVSNVAVVDVTVNDSTIPAANPDKAVTSVNVPVTINVLANDAAPAGQVLVPSSLAVTQPNAVEGTVTWSTTTGAMTFTPAPNFTGTSTFSYTVQDNSAPTAITSNSATVTVTVTAAAVQPTANTDNATAVSGVAT